MLINATLQRDEVEWITSYIQNSIHIIPNVPILILQERHYIGSLFNFYWKLDLCKWLLSESIRLCENVLKFVEYYSSICLNYLKTIIIKLRLNYEGCLARYKISIVNVKPKEVVWINFKLSSQKTNIFDVFYLHNLLKGCLIFPLIFNKVLIYILKLIFYILNF